MKLTKIVEAFKDVEDKIKENGEQGDMVSHGVSPSEKTAIKDYTNDSRAHNDLLHRRHHGAKGGTMDAKVYEGIKTLQQAIQKQEPLEGMHTFSGVKVDIDALFHAKSIKPFSTLQVFVPAFTSTTTHFSTVDSYAQLFYVNDASRELKNLITAHTPSAKSYRNILCFDLHGQRALKIDDKNGGVFGDSEKEFILPHSANIKISGTPTIKIPTDAMVGGSTTTSPSVLVVWDAEIIGVEETHISVDEDAKFHSLNVSKVKRLVFQIINSPDVQLDTQLEYRMIRGIKRLDSMYHPDKSERLECTGREMTYFEEQFINVLFTLQDRGVLQHQKSKVLEVFELLSASKKSLLASPMSDTRTKRELAKLLDEIFGHG
jgi:hypothetical protein